MLSVRQNGLKNSDKVIADMRKAVHASFISALIIMTASSSLYASTDTSGGKTASPAAAASAGFNNDMVSSSYMAQLVIGLVVVLACIVVLAWLARKMNRFQSAADGSLKIISGLSLGTRERIVLLQAGEKQLVVGVAPGRINTLAVLDEPVAPADENMSSSSGNSFIDKFRTAMTQAGTMHSGKGVNDE